MGKTIILSSHILTELSDVCDAVAIIEKGELVGSGDIGQLQKKTRSGDRVRIDLVEVHPEGIELIGSHPHVGSLHSEGKSVSFEYSGNPGDFHKLVKVLTDHGVPFLSIEYNPKNLEDLFLELTKGDVQ